MPARPLLVAVAMLILCSTGASARSLVVVRRGESLEPALWSRLLHPFQQATGLDAEERVWPGGMDILQQQAKAADNSWDVVELGPEELALGCTQGLLEKLDWSAIGGKSHYLPLAVGDCGVGVTLDSTVLTWDRSKFTATPTWADFWDVAKFPGKRGLRRGVRGNLEIALLADGVAPQDVYKVLATSEGVERAFRKLDQLRPYIVWWKTGAQAAKILGSGDVLMTTAPSAQIMLADTQHHRNFGMQFNNSLYEVLSWAIIKGSPQLKQAEQLLYFAGTPGVEAQLFRGTGEAGLAKDANDGLSADLLAMSATAPNNLKGALRIDTAFWHQNLAKLQKRFDAWLNTH